MQYSAFYRRGNWGTENISNMPRMYYWWEAELGGQGWNSGSITVVSPGMAPLLWWLLSLLDTWALPWTSSSPSHSIKKQLPNPVNPTPFTDLASVSFPPLLESPPELRPCGLLSLCFHQLPLWPPCLPVLPPLPPSLFHMSFQRSLLKPKYDRVIVLKTCCCPEIKCKSPSRSSVPVVTSPFPWPAPAKQNLLYPPLNRPWAGFSWLWTFAPTADLAGHNLPYPSLPTKVLATLKGPASWKAVLPEPSVSWMKVLGLPDSLSPTG